MSLAIFDLDNTLINGDSDHSWGEFLIEQGHVDAQIHKEKNDDFYRQYQAGNMDIQEFLSFALEPLGRIPMAELHSLHKQFMIEKIEPMILPAALALIEKHRTQGDTLLIITATNRFVTEPIAKRLGIDNLLASEVELIDGKYTGKSTDVPCFAEGKVTRLERWLKETGENLAASYFYSDSANDIPLLECVENPIAVDPCDRLRETANSRQWPIISLR